MNTADVVHSFWPPRFAGKRDVFPNRETRLWFKAEQAGEYPGQCAEFCGIQHGRMAFRVRAQTPEEFQSLGGPHADAGAQAARPRPRRRLGARPPARAPRSRPRSSRAPRQDAASREDRRRRAPDPAYAAGEKLFLAKGCVGCHSLSAVDAPKGMIGPNLANVGARSYIGAGQLKNTDENLARWIQNPQAMKKGVLMPNLGVKPEEARALVAYPPRSPITGHMATTALDQQRAHAAAGTRSRPGSGAGSPRSTTSGSGSSTAPPPSSSSCWAASRRC